MSVTLASLKSFYHSPLGKKLAQDCAAGLARFAPPARGDTLMGFGYTRPWLEKFAGPSSRALAFIPAALAEPGGPAGQAAGGGKNRKYVPPIAAASPRRAAARPLLLAENYKFPLDDAAIDCILAIHALEFSADAPAMLRELWRILVPDGRLILLVPNRRGLWAHAEKTPFGHGQPYSRRQLAEILGRNGFDFGEIDEYAHFLPHKSGHFTLASQLYEKLARRFFPYFGGVLMVEARKRLYNPLLTANVKRRLNFLPDFAPQPASLKPQNFIKTGP